MIQMDEPNALRIALLISDGFSPEEAEEIDRLERRENFLLDLDRAEGLDERLTRKLCAIQDKLRRHFHEA